MIRVINNDDIEAITSIYNHYINNTVVSFEEELVSIDKMSRRVAQVQALNYPWLVAEENKKIGGYAYADLWHTRSAYKHTVLVTIYLDPGFTGKGWGLKISKTLFDNIKACEVPSVIAGISLPNRSSVPLHEKMGLKKVAHFSEVGYKFGQWVDVVYWQGQLTQ